MNPPSSDELRNRYKSFSDLKLIDLFQSGELTEDASNVLREVLLKRNITPANFEEVRQKELHSKVEDIKAGDIPSPPKLWVGFMLTLLLFIGEIVHFSVYDEQNVRLSIFITPFMVACLIYYCSIVNRLHSILNVLSFDTYPISPGKAVGFHFIPFFNIYWLFKWPSELSKYINMSGDKKMVDGSVLGLLLVLSIVLIKTVDSAFGYTFVFATMAYVTIQVRKQISYQQNNLKNANNRLDTERA